MNSLLSIADTVGGRVLIGFVMLLVIGQMAVLILSVHQRRAKGSLLLVGLHLLLGMSLLIGLLAQFSYSPDMLIPSVYGPVYHLPWLLLLGVEGLSLGLLILSFVRCRRHRRSHLTPAAVKETVDLLETGICFCTQEGVALLTNVRMNQYCQALTGRILTDPQALWDQVRQAGENSGGQYLTPLPDGRMVLFDQTDAALDGVPCRQITAVDMTEQYRITEELKEKNKRLREHQLRLKILLAKSSALIPIQEILEARTAFHDQFGALLLTGKYYFENPGQTDPRALLLLVRQANRLLLEQVEGPDDAFSPYEEALRLCGRIGVQLNLTGAPPASQQARKVLGHAITECAANAVKHADGHALTVSFSQAGEDFTAVFTNDGAPPSQPIRESGGLLSLRQMTQNLGGSMEIETVPAFRLTLKIPLHA